MMNAMLNYSTPAGEIRCMWGYSSPKEFYINKIAEGVATFAASVYPKRIRVRLSDFTSCECKSPFDGKQYTLNEEKPAIGFRGYSCHFDPFFTKCFATDLEAVKIVRGEMGLKTVEIIIPFARIPDMEKNSECQRGVGEEWLEAGTVLWLCGINPAVCLFQCPGE